jgi:amidase
MTDLNALDATAQAALVRTDEVTPAELVDAAITRIEKLDPDLNAVVAPLFERARARAATDPPSGPFGGVPLLVKDLIAELEGTPFAEGSNLAGGYTSRSDQELTLRFERAGFVICGKTNTAEFGILPTTEPLRFGPTRNPWALGHSAGGSSGGSAAAVASGMVPVAHASDGGGSIRIPASCCGLFGLKPTRGRTTMAPHYGDVIGGLVSEHVVSRSVRDSAAILDAISGPAPGDPYRPPPPDRPYLDELSHRPGRLRIAVLTAAPNGTDVHPDCVEAAERTGELCAELGHEVTEARLPAFDSDAFTEQFLTLWASGTAWAVADWEHRLGRPANEEDVEPLTWALVSMGRATSADRYLVAVQGLQQLTRLLAGYFEDHDILLTPTLNEPPAPLGTFDSPPDEPLAGIIRAASYMPFLPVFNATGQPAASVPMHWNEAGLPIGVQLVARAGGEGVIFALASELEQARPWVDRRPPVFAGGG